MIQCIQEDQNLVRQPAEDEHSQNNKYKVCCFPFRTPSATFSHLLAALDDFGDVVATERYNRNRDEEANYADSHVVAQSPAIMGIFKVACVNAQMREKLHRAEEDSREAEQDPSNPDTGANPTCPECSSLPPLGQGSGEGQVSVHAHKCKKQHTTIIIHPNDNVDELAHGLPKCPVELVDNGRHPEWQAGNHEEISYCQVAQVNVGHGAAPLLETEHAKHKGVADHPKKANDGHVSRLHGVNPVPCIGVVTN
ncbi:Hypothetical predicted protein [Scomber scombrus]|uniref:Uncharacterized protein n=1 Tax=Scomber scombrus TaxID=13677 RepID=A0AAV1P4Z8_SCOSC